MSDSYTAMSKKNIDTTILPNLDIDIYHSMEGLSASAIKLLLNCPKKYWFNYLSGKAEKPDNKNFALGSAVHTLVLEPDTFNDRFHILETGERKTKGIKEESKDKGLTLLSRDDYQMVFQMANSINNNKIFKNIKNNINSYIENSILFKMPEYDVLLKSRPDYFNDKLVLDLKTTYSAHPSEFEREIYTYGYHIQAAMAIDAVSKYKEVPYKHFIILAVEKKFPYLTASYCLNQDAIEFGRKKYKEGIEIYLRCQESKKWPSYNEELNIIGLPKWVKTDERN